MSANQRQAERVQQRYDEAAPRYDSMISMVERLLLADGREWVGRAARGDLLEIAVGTGLNLSCYSADVTITGIDLSPNMITLARKRAENLGLAVDLAVGNAEQLPFADAVFDTVVSTLSLCTIPNPERAVEEVWRVLQPGGIFVALEHVRSPNAGVRIMQRMVNPIAKRCACDDLLREPTEYLLKAGFEIDHLERSKLGIVERVIGRKTA